MVWAAGELYGVSAGVKKRIPAHYVLMRASPPSAPFSERQWKICKSATSLHEIMRILRERIATHVAKRFASVD